MEVQRVRMQRRSPAPEAPEDREQRLPDRIREQQQRKPRRDLAIALHQHQRKEGQHQSGQIPSAVAKKNPPAREVDQEKAGQACRDRAGRGEDKRVVHRPRHDRQPDGSKQRGEAGQAVQAVDHADRARHPRHGHHRQGKRKGLDPEELVEDRDVDTRNAGIEQKEPERRCHRGKRQAHEHCAALGKILDQPPQKPGRDTNQQQSAQAHLPLPEPGREQARHEPDGDGDAAYPGRRIAVDLAQIVRVLVEPLPPAQYAAGEQPSSDPR